jgi:hypothetical protein
MVKPKFLPLSLVAIFVFACSIGSATPQPPPEETRTPSAVRLKPSPTRTHPLVGATARPPAVPTVPAAVPTYGADLSNIDAFFEYCPTSYEIERLLAEIPVAFEADPTAGSTPCMGGGGMGTLTEMQRRAYLTIMVMRHLSFDAPLPWTDKNLYRWFADTVEGIRFRSDIANSSCCDPAGVINIRVADNMYIVLTDLWVDSHLAGGLMDTMVLYVHEARHIEFGSHTCGNRDNTIAELGAWGVQYRLLEWLARHANPAFHRPAAGDPDLYRLAALDGMLSVRRERFCLEPTLTPGAAPTLR